MSLRTWKMAAAAATLLGLGLGMTADTADAGQKLVVKRFLLGRLEPNTDKFIATGARGTTNAFRDNVAMFVFSRPVNMDSINDRTIKVGIPAGAGLFIDAEGSFYRYVRKQYNPASGTFEPKRTYRNRVIFDPTSRQEPLIRQNPFGFEADSLYSVTVPGVDSGTTKTVRGRRGEYNLRSFTTTFRTTSTYLQDYVQPRIVKVEASDAPGVPLEGRLDVDSSADIIAYFSEPMLPGSFDLEETFQVYNNGTGRLVTGTIRAAPDGMSFTFRPVFGYGRGPFNIRVELTANITDRSQNPLDRGLVVNFTSEFDPFAPNFNEITEDFTTNTYEDTDFGQQAALADWNSQKEPGQLSGVFGGRQFDITFGATGGHAIPWWTSQGHTQQLFTASHFGNTPRTISDFHWRYYQSTTIPQGTYSSVSVLMGHNTTGNLATSFTGSYSDTPVTVVNAASYTTSSSAVEWCPGPTWSNTWAFNGNDNVVLEINQPNGGTRNLYWRYSSSPGWGGTTHIRAYSGGTASGMNWGHETRFFYLVDRSEAQSLWYDTTVVNPQFLEPIVSQDVPPGTVVSVTFQGGHEDVNNAGSVDETSLSIWTSDAEADLTNFRYIRFHVDMTSNLGSKTKPVITEVKLPFVFF